MVAPLLLKNAALRISPSRAMGEAMNQPTVVLERRADELVETMLCTMSVAVGQLRQKHPEGFERLTYDGLRFTATTAAVWLTCVGLSSEVPDEERTPLERRVQRSLAAWRSEAVEAYAELHETVQEAIPKVPATKRRGMLHALAAHWAVRGASAGGEDPSADAAAIGVGLYEHLVNETVGYWTAKEATAEALASEDGLDDGEPASQVKADVAVDTPTATLSPKGSTMNFHWIVNSWAVVVVSSVVAGAVSLFYLPVWPATFAWKPLYLYVLYRMVTLPAFDLEATCRLVIGLQERHGEVRRPAEAKSRIYPAGARWYALPLMLLGVPACQSMIWLNGVVPLLVLVSVCQIGLWARRCLVPPGYLSRRVTRYVEGSMPVRVDLPLFHSIDPGLLLADLKCLEHPAASGPGAALEKRHTLER